ncbi:MAG: DUF4252 domain-containing protein [Flavobacteriaceae bacterium]
MKKVLILIALVIAPAVSFGQSVFDKLEDMNEVSSVVINKDAFEILSKFKIETDDNNEGVRIFKMIQNLNEFKSFSTEDEATATTMEKMVNSVIKSKKLTQLMRVKDKDSRVKIYVDATKNKEIVNEVVMFIKGIKKHTDGKSEAVVVSLTGKINMNQLSELADSYTKKKK